MLTFDAFLVLRNFSNQFLSYRFVAAGASEMLRCVSWICRLMVSLFSQMLYRPWKKLPMYYTRCIGEILCIMTCTMSIMVYLKTSIIIAST